VTEKHFERPLLTLVVNSSRFQTSIKGPSGIKKQVLLGEL